MGIRNCIAALATVAWTTAVLSVPVRSATGGRNIVALNGGGEESTAILYVQDGLVAMFDGRENAGWGVHDHNPSEWKSLVSEDAIPLSAEDCAVGDTHVVTASGRNIGGIVSALTGMPYSQDNPVTIEVVFSIVSYPTYAPFVSLGGRELRTYADTNIRSMRTEIAAPGRAANKAATCIVSTTINSTLVNSFSFMISQVPNSGIGDTTVAVNGSYVSPSRRSVVNFSLASDELVIGFSTTGSVQIYCIRIYDRALSAEETVYNFEVDKARYMR